MQKKHILIYAAHALPQSPEICWTAWLLFPAMVQICHAMLASTLHLLWLSLWKPLSRKRRYCYLPLKFTVPRKWKTRVLCKSEKEIRNNASTLTKKKGIQPAGCSFQETRKVRPAQQSCLGEQPSSTLVWVGELLLSHLAWLHLAAGRMAQNAKAEWCQGPQTDVSEQKLSGCLGSSRERRHKWLPARHSVECQTWQLNWHMTGQCPGWPALLLVLSFL